MSSMEMLSIRTANILKHEGIENINDLKRHWNAHGTVKMFKGIGSTSDREVELALKYSSITFPQAIRKIQVSSESISRMSRDIEFWKSRYEEAAEAYKSLLNAREKIDDSSRVIEQKSKIMMAYIQYITSKLDATSERFVSLSEFSLIRSGGFLEE